MIRKLARTWAATHSAGAAVVGGAVDGVVGGAVGAEVEVVDGATVVGRATVVGAVLLEPDPPQPARATAAARTPQAPTTRDRRGADGSATRDRIPAIITASRPAGRIDRSGGRGAPVIGP
jgi:hypothetical protein